MPAKLKANNPFHSSSSSVGSGSPVGTEGEYGEVQSLLELNPKSEEPAKTSLPTLRLSASELTLYPPQANRPPGEGQGKPLEFFYGVKLRPALSAVLDDVHLSAIDRQVGNLAVETVANRMEAIGAGVTRIEAIGRIKRQLDCDLEQIQKSLDHRLQAINRRQEEIDAESCCCGPLRKEDRQRLRDSEARVDQDRASLTTEQKLLSAAKGKVARLQGVVKEEKLMAGIPVVEAEIILNVRRA
jgi:hypothetical protein